LDKEDLLHDDDVRGVLLLMNTYNNNNNTSNSSEKTATTTTTKSTQHNRRRTMMLRVLLLIPFIGFAQGFAVEKAFLKVKVIQLQDKEGTPYTLNNGEKDGMSVVAFLESEQRSILSLKEKINSLYFPALNRPIGRIRVYSRPKVISGGSPQSWVNHEELDEALVEGTTYGFMDLTTQLQQPASGPQVSL
jgi:hypothetical protein